MKNKEQNIRTGIWDTSGHEVSDMFLQSQPIFMPFKQEDTKASEVAIKQSYYSNGNGVVMKKYGQVKGFYMEGY